MKIILGGLLFTFTLVACAPNGSYSDANSETVPINTANSSSENTNGIIGGNEVSNLDPIASTVVSLYDTSSGAGCTGSIISENLIITAAHCVGQNPKSIVAIFDTKVSSKSVNRRISSGVVNPRYKTVTSFMDNNPSIDPDTIKEWGDIAVLKFSGTLPKGFRSAAILSSSSLLKDGATVTLAGYGYTNGVLRTGGDVLAKVDVKLSQAQFSKGEVLLDQRQGKGACHGDSGGPAYIKINGLNYLFGVTSRGYKDRNDDCSQFSVYTNALSYLNWINQTSKSL